MKKPKVEVRELIPGLIKADNPQMVFQNQVKQLRRHAAKLTETRVRISHDGGKGWAFELATTDLRIQQVVAALSDAIKTLNSISARIQE